MRPPSEKLAIFRSLLGSAFDVYGDVDRDVARRVLARLDLPKSTNDLTELKRKLGFNVR